MYRKGEGVRRNRKGGIMKVYPFNAGIPWNMPGVDRTGTTVKQSLVEVMSS